MPAGVQASNGLLARALPSLTACQRIVAAKANLRYPLPGISTHSSFLALAMHFGAWRIHVQAFRPCTSVPF